MNPTAEIQADSASAYHQLPETTLLPTDRHYRMTGERTQVEKPEDSTPSKDKEKEAKEQDAAPSGEKGEESEIAAASEAAPEEQEEETEEKPKPRSQSRWERLSKENRELRDRLSRLESASAPRETRQESQPAADSKAKPEPRPKIDDVDPKTGRPKYASYEDYEAARDEWLRKDTLREFQEVSARTQQETQQAQAKQRVAEEWGKRCESARKKHADYDEVALNPSLPIKEGGVVDAYIVSRPNGSEVLYFLGQNPDTLDAINAMNPIDAVYALSEIELGLSAPVTAPKPVTRAATPPHQTSTAGAVQRDAVEAALKDGDSLAYRREANNRDPRLLAVRRSRGK